MRKIFLFFEFFLFLSYSIENIYYLRNNDMCGKGYDVFDSIYKDGRNGRSYKAFYGFNAQHCSLKFPRNSCCYVSLKYNKEWYHFCAKVTTGGDTKIWLDNFKNNMTNYTTSLIEGINIDCFSKKVFVKFLYFIGLILLF